MKSSRTFFSYLEPREKEATRCSSIALVNVTTAVSAGIGRKVQVCESRDYDISVETRSEQRVGFTGGIRNIPASLTRESETDG